MPKTIFFSFSSEDEIWVRQFARREYFGSHLRNCQIFNYKVKGQALPFGPLDEWLRERVNECVAICVFLSKSFTASKACRLELEAALPRFIENKIVFVPVVLDQHGAEFWDALKDREEYRAHLVGYQFCDFVADDGNGPRPVIVKGEPEYEVVQQIVALAKAVQSRITYLGPKPDDGGGGPGPSTQRLILLGDPLRPTVDEEIAADFDRLETQLARAKVPYKTWHAWRKAEPGSAEKLPLPATFLRVVNRYQSEDEEKAPNTLQWLNDCGRVEGEVKEGVILWEPHASDAVERQLDWGILRKDTAQALANWLVERFGASTDAPDLLIIDEPRYAVVAFAELIRMVSDVASTKMRGKSMNSEQFKYFLRQADKRNQKFVVAVLDSNVNMCEEHGFGPMERFEKRVEDWQREFKQIRGQTAKVVWVGVMTKLAHLAPFAIWPKETEEPIYVLKVTRAKRDDTDPDPEGGGPRGPGSPGGASTSKFKIDPDSAVMVASAVRELLGENPGE